MITGNAPEKRVVLRGGRTMKRTGEHSGCRGSAGQRSLSFLRFGTAAVMSALFIFALVPGNVSALHVTDPLLTNRCYDCHTLDAADRSRNGRSSMSGDASADVTPSIDVASQTKRSGSTGKTK